MVHARNSEAVGKSDLVGCSTREGECIRIDTLINPHANEPRAQTSSGLRKEPEKLTDRNNTHKTGNPVRSDLDRTVKTGGGYW